MLRTLAIASGVAVLVWAAFIAVLLVVRPRDLAMRDAVRLLPDTLRLVRRIAADRSVPLRARLPVWLLLV